MTAEVRTMQRRAHLCDLAGWNGNVFPWDGWRPPAEVVAARGESSGSGEPPGGEPRRGNERAEVVVEGEESGAAAEGRSGDGGVMRIMPLVLTCMYVCEDFHSVLLEWWPGCAVAGAGVTAAAAAAAAV